MPRATRSGRQRRWVVGLALVAVVLLGLHQAVQALEPIRLMLNGQVVTPDVAPVIQNGRVMVPLRFVAEQLGARVDWFAEDRTVTIWDPGLEARDGQMAGDPEGPGAGGTPHTGSTGLADVVEAVRPSVVTLVALDGPAYGNAKTVVGWGSGTIITDDGLILTNAHVVQGRYQFLVITADQRKLAVERVWADQLSDVAVVKVAATGLPEARLGSTDPLRVGDGVFAIGTPYSLRLQSTVTTGIISGKGRSAAVFYPYLQTDAAINQGNSGGALVNMSGEVVGIPTLKVIEEGFQGLGFAIPIEVAVHIKDQLLKNGYVVRPYLGVGVEESPDANIGLPSDEGLLVIRVEEGGPAQRAGVLAGDTVTHLNERPVSTLSDIYEVLFELEVGQQVRLRILRNNRTIDLWVRLEERRN